MGTRARYTTPTGYVRGMVARVVPTMSVTTMHDLGGCRVVFETVDEVEDLVHRPARATKGIHLAYEYGASKPEYDEAHPR